MHSSKWLRNPEMAGNGRNLLACRGAVTGPNRSGLGWGSGSGKGWGSGSSWGSGAGAGRFNSVLAGVFPSGRTR